jgi:hypothetical protein
MTEIPEKLQRPQQWLMDSGVDKYAKISVMTSKGIDCATEPMLAVGLWPSEDIGKSKEWLSYVGAIDGVSMNLDAGLVWLLGPETNIWALNSLN